MFDQLTRRSALRNGATAVLGGLGLGAGKDIIKGSVPDEFARAFDIDDDGTAHLQFVEADAPSMDRGTVLHATSGGTATRDYAVTLRSLMFESLTLDDLISAGLEYDYYVGSDNTSMSPNEVCLVLGGKKSGVDIVFRTKDDDREGGWYTRDVTSEFTGDSELPGSDQPWKRFDIDHGNIKELGASNVTHLEESLLDSYEAGTRVLGAGLGHGAPTMDEVTVDTFYDRFTIGSETYDLHPTK